MFCHTQNKTHKSKQSKHTHLGKQWHWVVIQRPRSGSFNTGLLAFLVLHNCLDWKHGKSERKIFNKVWEPRISSGCIAWLSRDRMCTGWSSEPNFHHPHQLSNACLHKIATAGFVGCWHSLTGGGVGRVIRLSPESLATSQPVERNSVLIGHEFKEGLEYRS